MNRTVRAYAGLLLLLFSGSSLAASTLTPLYDRPPAPDFNLADMDGNPVSLGDFRGQVLVINFWATWCPPCRKEMASIEKGAKWLARFNGHFITINMGEKPAAIQRYLKKQPVDLPILLDPDGKTAADWGVQGLPVTYVVDPEGRIAYKAIGAREWDDPKLLVPIRSLGLDQ